MMKNNKNLLMRMFIAVFLFGSSSFQVKAQQSFSLAQAQDYAVKNSINSVNAKLNIDMAKAKKNEVTGIGLPQISSSVDFKDYLELPTSLIPGEFFGAPPGTYLPLKFGTQYNTTAGISANQLVFSSDYIVGLQASKTYMELAQKSETRTKIETITAVASAYYGALIAKESSKLLDINIERLDKMILDMKALNNNGFIEKIDLDRIEVNYNNLLVEKQNAQRMVNVSEALLKFQMGLDPNQSITLTDSLDSFVSTLTEINDFKPNPKSRIEYSILETQNKLNELDLRRHKMSYLPSLVAYGSITSQAQRKEFDIFDTKKKWFPIGVVGATLSLPIFDGLQKHYRVEQAKITLLMSKNNLNQFQNAASLETSNASAAYNNALATFKLQKRNIELAENVYNVTKIKYEQGVGSNLEVIEAQSSYRTALVNYYSALYEALNNKVNLDKALGNIK